MGIHGISIGDAERRATDYDRACSTQEYVEILPCDAGEVLVLGDEPHQSSFFWTESGELAVVRWVYAQSGADIESFLLAPSAKSQELAPPLPFLVQQGRLILFDSALRSADVGSELTAAEVAHGAYLVTTEKREVAKQFNFIVHTLRKAGGG
jgi:hypothetical protein